MIEQQIFRMEEVAAATAQSRSQVYSDKKIGILETIQIGGRRRVTRVQLARYIEHLTGEAAQHEPPVVRRDHQGAI